MLLRILLLLATVFSCTGVGYAEKGCTVAGGNTLCCNCPGKGSCEDPAAGCKWTEGKDGNPGSCGDALGKPEVGPSLHNFATFLTNLVKATTSLANATDAAAKTPGARSKMILANAKMAFDKAKEQVAAAQRAVNAAQQNLDAQKGPERAPGAREDEVLACMIPRVVDLSLVGGVSRR